MTKSAKRSIIVSAILAIVMCASLMAGATLAIFTSESKVNIAVTSGKVDVVATASDLWVYSPTSISMETGNEIINPTNAATQETDANTGTFKNGGTATLTDGTLTLAKMTPGDKVTFVVTVTNMSNVSVKYRTVIKKVDSTDEELYKVLDFDIGGFSPEYYSAWQKIDAATAESGDVVKKYDCTVEMPTTVEGDGYMDKTCTIAIIVEAVQGNAITPTYVSNETELLTALKVAGDKHIVFANDITVEDSEDPCTEELYVKGDNVVIDMGENTLTIPQCFTFDGTTAVKVTFRNGTVISNNVFSYNIFAWDAEGSELTLDGVTVKYADTVTSAYALICNNDSAATINLYNSTIVGRVDIAYGLGVLNIKNTTLDRITVSNSDKAHVINIYEGTVMADASNNLFDIHASNATVNIYGGTFTVAQGKRFVGDLAANVKESSTVNFYGGTINDQGISYYTAEQDGSDIFHNVIAPEDKSTTDYTQSYSLTQQTAADGTEYYQLERAYTDNTAK